METTQPGIPTRMLTDDGKLIHFKVLSLGVWNMTTTANHTINHGIGTKYKNLISINCYIINDADNRREPLDRMIDAIDPGLLAGGIKQISSTQISFERRTLGGFADGNYETLATSRGYVVISYFE